MPILVAMSSPGPAPENVTSVGSRKSTAYAAQVVTQDAGRTAMSHGMKEVVVKLNGPGMGRDRCPRTSIYGYDCH